jgi:hypothetical protein
VEVIVVLAVNALTTLVVLKIAKKTSKDPAMYLNLKLLKNIIL